MSYINLPKDNPLDPTVVSTYNPNYPETNRLSGSAGIYSKGIPKEVYDKIHSDGGPTDYYDFPASWTTFNDFIEHKSQTQWLGFSFHLGNIGKAICRWGDKNGTTEEYDAKKIVYSGVRILKMLIGIEATRQYLQRLLDDPQFKP